MIKALRDSLGNFKDTLFLSRSSPSGLSNVYSFSIVFLLSTSCFCKDPKVLWTCSLQRRAETATNTVTSTLLHPGSLLSSLSTWSTLGVSAESLFLLLIAFNTRLARLDVTGLASVASVSGDG